MGQLHFEEAAASAVSGGALLAGAVQVPLQQALRRRQGAGERAASVRVGRRQTVGHLDVFFLDGARQEPGRWTVTGFGYVVVKKIEKRTKSKFRLF